MAARRIDIKDYCESLYTELFSMKSRLGEFVTTLEHMEGKQKETLNSHIKHLNEMVSFIEWKLEIFYNVCPVDLSRFGQEIESIVSVPPVETKESEQIPGGYVGG